MSKKGIKIFIVIIVILLIVALICIFKSERSDRVSNIYKKITQNKCFTFSMEEPEFEYKVFLYQKDADICIDMYSGEDHNTTLVLNNEAYYIMHNNKEYYSYGDEPIDTDVVIAGLKNVLKNKYESGKETINGREYYYEEFENDESDFIIFANVNEESKIKTRFYFEGDNLVYIKNIVDNIDENEPDEELVKVELSYNVDEDLFKIPEDYAEIGD